ncbi:MAG: hypothetical protein Q8N99_02325 [Nanoarchaeota archaeon]|nr:hypothetical protein [Nanoarchaeota archaeon]
MTIETDPVKLEKSRKYADSLSNSSEKVDTFKVVSALEILALANEETRFRKVVDAQVQQLKKDGKIDEPYSFAEWLCMGVDHGFAIIESLSLAIQPGISVERLPVKTTQEFFQRLYGSHFYLGDKAMQN